MPWSKECFIIVRFFGLAARVSVLEWSTPGWLDLSMESPEVPYRRFYRGHPVSPADLQRIRDAAFSSWDNYDDRARIALRHLWSASFWVYMM